MLPMAVARFSSGGVVIRYVLPVLWMTIFAHEPRLLDVAAQLKRSAHIALGLAINCAQQYQLNARSGLLFGIVMAVASAGPYANNLHLTANRKEHQHPIT